MLQEITETIVTIAEVSENGQNVDNHKVTAQKMKVLN